MGLKAPGVLLFFLLACFALARRETRHEKFRRQHVDFPKTRVPHARHYCNLLMQRRNLTVGTCKLSNTFIHAAPAQVDSVCTTGGAHHNENYYDSNVAFALTACRVVGGSQQPPCNYRSKLSTQRIRVACVNGVPVHYKGQA